MSQQDLDFGRDSRVGEAHRRVLRSLNDVVDAVGLMVAAGACGCRTSELSDALSGRSNRYVRIEWLLAILDLAPPDFRVQLGVTVMEWVGLTVTPAKPLTPEEKLARLEQRIAAEFGAAGKRVIEESQR